VERALQTFTIHEVSRLLRVPKHTLRYWERVLGGIIVPLRTEGRQRRYASEHLLIIEEIKRLKGKGLTLDDIRRRLGDAAKEHQDDPVRHEVDQLADRIAEIVKTAISSFLERERSHQV
jgi:DNA-binding transcriptional MerR regulator